ncbi:MAG TPA: prepilin-type N-terminal cleavage/methylation domain-containing protein [Syntrophorhabdaceae bacterium]|nr:prepilin-type N-terminal cleavage/methylation domain-containing protein [Syntrophorhabdaceae bacterium]
MKTKGFTIIELLVGVVVICVVLAIAFPMHAMRVKKKEQVSVRSQLQCIFESERAYRSLHGTYTDDVTKLAQWKNRTRKYHFSIRHADSKGFVAEANGDLNNDKVYDDRWTIDQNGTLANVK